MIDPEVQWTTPEPLWANVTDVTSDLARQFFRRPAILRFATDTFMTDFMTLLESNPARLKEFPVQRETWRGPAVTPEIESVEKLPAFAKRLNRSRLAALRVAGAAVANSSGVTAQAVTTVDTQVAQAAPRPLKLYQPAHQRFYLLTACLVCRLPGQPDRHIETSQQERVSYVIRRVSPLDGQAIELSTEKDWKEYAFVNTPTGPAWQLITNVHSLALKEDQIPMFAVSFAQDDGHRRRLLAGLVPVGKREVYVSAPECDPRNQHLISDPASPPPDPRTVLLQTQITGPWKAAIDRAASARKLHTLVPPPVTDDKPLSDKPAALKASIKAVREQLQTISWYVLLDLAEFLQQYLKPVWDKLLTDPHSGNPVITQLRNIAVEPTLLNTATDYHLFAETPYQSSDVPTTLIDALKLAVADKLTLEQATRSFDRQFKNVTGAVVRDPLWPTWLFPLADPVMPVLPLPDGTPQQTEHQTAQQKALRDAQIAVVDALEAAIVTALQTADPQSAPPLPLAAQPIMAINNPAWFVIRCVFERPNCGPLHPTVVSDATEPFQMAGFFDPDAPARPIRIALPIDTSPAGLRKFDKNTAFMISDVLCGQIDRVKSLGLGDLVRSVLPWPLHKDLDVPDGGPCTTDSPEMSLGMICSLSIPIITICALILLMIIVSLLDFIFKWIPYFIMCFPLPKFSGKPKPPIP